MAAADTTAGRSAPAFRPRSRRPLALTLPSVVAVGVLVLPLTGLLVRAPWSQLGRTLTDPMVLDAMRISLVSSVGALLMSVVLGVPLAWLLARGDFRGQSLLRALVLVPLVLPPVVAGVALLLAFGPRGVVGGLLERVGVVLPFSTAGTVLAAGYVALPFLVLTVEGALHSLDRTPEEVAETLGASPLRVFWTVTLPAAAPALVSGCALAWARALGEFGATITFAGNIQGVTQTMPLAIYQTLPTDPAGALTLGLLMLATSTAVIVALQSRWVTPLRRWAG